MRTVFLVLISSLMTPTLPAQDIAPPKSGQCVACHSADGQSVMADTPILRCQHQVYLVSALNAYRNGTRHYPVMNSVANTLQPKDISAIAAWYAHQPGCKQ